MSITYARGLGCIVPACSWHFLLTRIWHTYNCDDTMSMDNNTFKRNLMKDPFQLHIQIGGSWSHLCGSIEIQECIPVGCLPSAASVVSGGNVCSWGVSAPGGGVWYPSIHWGRLPLWTEWLTDRCKIITFATSLRTVKMGKPQNLQVVVTFWQKLASIWRN